MRALITGITGFVGSHLAEYILENHAEVEVGGLIRWRSPRDHITGIVERIQLHYGNLLDMPSLRRLLAEFRPDFIFHLAAQSYVDFSFIAPVDTLETNVVGTCNLLEVVRQLKDEQGYDPVVHICNSSEVYGQDHDSVRGFPVARPGEDTSSRRNGTPKPASAACYTTLRRTCCLGRTDH